MNPATTGPAWTSEQREWLQALGHDVLTLVQAGAPQQAAAGAVAPAMPASPPVSAPARAGTDVPPLLRALARAARREADDPELLHTVPDLATLRGNPAARRALWPRLRGLRRTAPR